MPRFLQFLTFAGQLCAVLPVMTFLPGVPFYVNGQVVDPIVFWSSGPGMAEAVAGVSLGLSSVLIIRRHIYARTLHVVAWCALCAAPLIDSWSHHVKVPVVEIALGVAWIAIVGVYLARSKAVQAYFDRAPVYG